MNYKPEIIGVVGSGNFGTTIAGIIAKNCNVLLYCRRAETAQAVNEGKKVLGFKLPSNVRATTSIEDICSKCKVLIPVVPSAAFRNLIQSFAPYLHPYHVLIHGTKGFDIVEADLLAFRPKITRANIQTMSGVIKSETQVVRVGCISGPNLSVEIRKGLPTATVVASEFDEVINIGYQILNSESFKIYGSYDLLGTEIAGTLKNMIAVGTGMIAGLKLGRNIESLFITRGLREMLIVGKALGADGRTFFGTAGLGDLIATATSRDSRNYSFGLEVAKGKSKKQIDADFKELTEGVRTIELMYHFSIQYQLDVPIVEMLYSVIFKELPLDKAMSYLLDYPYAIDVDYI